jgi:hypothetical protein
MQSVQEKAARYWPQAWISAGGQPNVSNDQIAEELRALAMLVADSDSSEYLSRAAGELEQIGKSTKA